MKPLLLAGAIATLVAAPHTTLLAQTSVDDSTASAVRARANAGLGDTVAPRAATVSAMPNAHVPRATHAEMMGAANNAVSHRTDDSTQTETIVGGISIREVAEGAGFVTLADGTRWQVALEDRARVEQWQAGDHVIVRFAPIRQGPRFFYRLENGRDASEALVAFRGLEEPAN